MSDSGHLGGIGGFVQNPPKQKEMAKMSVSLQKFEKYGICGCEHIQHKDATSGKVDTLHEEYKVPASSVWCMYVGHVCLWCSKNCLPEYVIVQHDCAMPGSDCARYGYSSHNSPIVNEKSVLTQNEIWEGITVELRRVPDWFDSSPLFRNVITWT